MWWMALAGAIAGQASYLWETDKNLREIDRQKQQARQAYQYQKEYNQNSFNLQKGEALETLGIQKNRLAESFDADVAGFNLGLEGQALQTRDAQINLADSAGAALARQGASGVRGSDALRRRIDYAQTSFDRQLDLQERGNSLSMRNMTRQYSNSFSDIGREIDSWSTGGYRYEANELGKTYASEMHGLEMAGYEHAYADAGFNIMDFLTAGLSGAGAGAGFGQQMDSYKDQKGTTNKMNTSPPPQLYQQNSFSGFGYDYSRPVDFSKYQQWRFMF